MKFPVDQVAENFNVTCGSGTYLLSDLLLYYVQLGINKRWRAQYFAKMVTALRVRHLDYHEGLAEYYQRVETLVEDYWEVVLTAFEQASRRLTLPLPPAARRSLQALLVEP